MRGLFSKMKPDNKNLKDLLSFDNMYHKHSIYLNSNIRFHLM